MSALDPSDPIAVLLAAHRAALISRITQRIQQEIPDYATVAQAEIQVRYTVIVDAMSKSLITHDPSHLTNLLVQVARPRLVQGYTIDALLTAARIVEQSYGELITREVSDPRAQTVTLRQITNLIGTVRHVLSRLHLSVVVDGPQSVGDGGSGTCG